MKEQNEIIEQIKELKTPNSNPAIYLVSLLFAIELNCVWLIIVFSCLFGINIFCRLNKKYKFITIETSQK